MTDVKKLLISPERAVDVPLDRIPALLAQLASVQVALLARLVADGNGPKTTPGPAEDDRLLNAEEAASILGTAPRWLYRHARQLPFTRRLSRKVLRFSQGGLKRYMATRRLS